ICKSQIPNHQGRRDPSFPRFPKAAQNAQGAAVNALDLLDLSRSTLKQSEISSSPASLTLDEVVSNIEAMKWQECCLTKNGRKSFWLEKASGKKCVMLATGQLWITWGKSNKYWVGLGLIQPP
ncbi:hypothetical protein AALP_AA8G257800, partial [Arabis alpina]